MRMVRPAVAVAAVLLLMECPTRAEDSLAADQAIADVVDHEIEAALGKERVKPANLADDATLCRRLTLDLAGRIPTALESRAFVQSTEPDKRVRLVDRLMASSGFVGHQANELDTMLMAGTTGSLREYLVKAVGENRAWDKIFRELLLPDQSDKLQKVAALYLRQRVKDLDRLTADVSSTFFGVNISCAQCHDHPLVRDWKQDHFYGMKSFLSRTFVSGTERAGFLGERSSGTIRFKTTDDVEKQARLMFLTGRRVDEPDAREATKDEEKAEKAALALSKKNNVPPPPPKFSARAKLVEVALAARGARVFRKGDCQSHLVPALRPRPGDAARPDAFGEPAQPSGLARLAGARLGHARLRPAPLDTRAGALEGLRTHQPLGRGRGPQAVALRRGRRAAADALSTGDLAQAGDP